MSHSIDSRSLHEIIDPGRNCSQQSQNFIKNLLFTRLGGIWYLMSLSTICQLYRGSQFYWWSKPESQIKPLTCHKSPTNYLLEIQAHLTVKVSYFIKKKLQSGMKILGNLSQYPLLISQISLHF
jgi:hypothetical protein